MGLAVSESTLQDWIRKGLIDPLPTAAPAREEPDEDSASEKDFQADVEKFAKRHGWRLYHTRDSRKSAGGFPDLVLLRGPRLIVAELKVGCKNPTSEQTAWLDAFRAAGVPSYIWRPSDWPVIAKALGE